jgi:acetate kinase
MKVLVINSGSSSLKYTLFEMADESILFSGLIDRIGLSGQIHSFTYGAGGPASGRNVNVADHGQALDELFLTLLSGPLTSLDELPAVAHRVAHGGKYKEAVIVDDDVIAEIRKMTPFIPLHHPAMVSEIEECRVRMPHAKHVAVFDMSFHRTIPEKAAIYGLPYSYYADRGYRRTGFHGHSHQYVSIMAAEFMGVPVDKLKIITCHLGNGSSVAAIDSGRSIDTSLGMTAVEGLMMGTRSGDVDPGLIPVIMKEDGLDPDQLIDLLYRKSGLIGISGVSRDMREIQSAAEYGDKRASLALDAFCYKVKRYIGSMLMVLGGCDVLAFAGGIGRNSPLVRMKALEGAEELGFVIDQEMNRVRTDDVVWDITHSDSKIKILTVQTFEEIMMARECAEVVAKLGGR